MCGLARTNVNFKIIAASSHCFQKQNTAKKIETLIDDSVSKGPVAPPPPCPAPVYSIIAA
jgi:hypothetical protein